MRKRRKKIPKYQFNESVGSPPVRVFSVVFLAVISSHKPYQQANHCSNLNQMETSSEIHLQIISVFHFIKSPYFKAMETTSHS